MSDKVRVSGTMIELPDGDPIAGTLLTWPDGLTFEMSGANWSLGHLLKVADWYRERHDRGLTA